MSEHEHRDVQRIGNERHVQERREREKPRRALTDRETTRWGAVGGFFFVAANAGLFDIGGITKMLDQSQRPGLQLTAFAVFCLVIIVAGAVWARIHRPVMSVFVAVQLGVVAPMAIQAMVHVGTNQAQQVADALGPLDGFLIGTAHAQVRTPAPQPPSPIQCIVRSIVQKPC